MIRKLLMLCAVVVILAIQLPNVSTASELDALKEAAGQGDAEAQFNLGIMYSTGRGVPRSDTEAVRWYRMAAEQGFAEAQFSLGLKYVIGHGVPREDVQAYAWWNIAAAQGNENAKKNLGWLTENLSSSEISEAQKLSHNTGKHTVPAVIRQSRIDWLF